MPRATEDSLCGGQEGCAVRLDSAAGRYGVNGERALDSIIAAAGQADSRDDLHAFCRRIADRIGARWYFFVQRVASASFVDPHSDLVDCYPAGLMSRYRDQDYILVDPVIRHCYQHVVPGYWNEIHADLPPGTPERALVKALREYGLLTGMTLPVHGLNGEISMLCLALDEEGPDVEARLRHHAADIMCLAAYLHEAAIRVLGRERQDAQMEPLTRREQECLMWCAEGKTSWETAQILGISERTIIFHLQNVTVKLGVSSRQQAVARATVCGIILPVIRNLPAPS